MAKRLGDDDRNAVDVVLDQHAADNGTSAKLFVTQSNLAERVTRVQRLLRLLDRFSPLEPPPDLVNKTLSRISQETYMRPERLHQAPQALPSESHQA
jgi:hypothetical protein